MAGCGKIATTIFIYFLEGPPHANFGRFPSSQVQEARMPCGSDSLKNELEISKSSSTLRS